MLCYVIQNTVEQLLNATVKMLAGAFGLKCYK